MMMKVINSQKTIKITSATPKFNGVVELSTFLGEMIKIDKGRTRTTETRQKIAILSDSSIKFTEIYSLSARI